MKEKQKRNIVISIIVVIILLFLIKSCQEDSILKDTDRDGFTDIEERKEGTDIDDPTDYPVGEPVPEHTILYRSQYDCEIACQRAGFDTGGCMNFYPESTLRTLGSCVILGTICETEGACKCYCKNVEEVNPLDIFTCGDVGDEYCEGTCPDEYPKCMNKHYDTYDACVCFSDEGISPDWDVGGAKHHPK